MSCPCCGSNNVKFLTLKNSKFLVCDDCNYDESEEILEIYPNERKSRSGKGTPYKKGGHQRTMKKIK